MGIDPIMIAGRSLRGRSIDRRDDGNPSHDFCPDCAATLVAVIVVAILGRDDDRLNEGLLIGIYVGALGSISVLFILRSLGLF
jgi:hypothetical protein